MATSGLPISTPDRTEETEVFWAGLDRDELWLRRCQDCKQITWYPREMCPECHSVNGAWERTSGAGSVYSFSVVRRGQEGYEDVTPYVLAWIELDEGPRVMSNVVDVDPSAVEVGMRVAAYFDRVGEGPTLLRFGPT